jgi:hypothetical protein
MKKNILFVFTMSLTVAQAQIVDWVRQGADVGNSRCYAVSSDGSGFVYASGSASPSAVFDSVALPGYGALDVFVAKYHRNGAIQWAISFGGTGNDEALDATTDLMGNSYVTGYVGTNATIGSQNFTSPYAVNFFICKINSSGVVQWAKFFSNAGDNSEGKSVSVTDQGQKLAVTGFFRNVADFDSIHIIGNYEDVFTARLDPQTGNPLWVRTGGGSGDDEGQGIAIDVLGNVTTSGYYKSNATFDAYTLPGAGNKDVFIIKYDPNGNIVWAKTGAGPGWDAGYRVMLDAFGNVYTEGEFSTGANFDGTVLTSNGSRDGYLIKYDGAGNLKWIISGGSPGNGLEYFSDFAFDAYGYLWCTGSFEGAAIIDTFHVTTQAADIVLCRVDTTGQVLNVLLYGGPGPDYGFGLTYVPECFIALGGFFSGTANFGGISMTAVGGEEACMVLVDATCTIGIGDHPAREDVNVFPNPSSGSFTVETSDAWGQDSEIILYSVTGQCVLRQKTTGIRTAVGAEAIAPGLYIVSVQSSRGTVRKRIHVL